MSESLDQNPLFANEDHWSQPLNLSHQAGSTHSLMVVELILSNVKANRGERALVV